MFCPQPPAPRWEQGTPLLPFYCHFFFHPRHPSHLTFYEVLRHKSPATSQFLLGNPGVEFPGKKKKGKRKNNLGPFKDLSGAQLPAFLIPTDSLGALGQPEAPRILRATPLKCKNSRFNLKQLEKIAVREEFASGAAVSSYFGHGRIFCLPCSLFLFQMRLPRPRHEISSKCCVASGFSLQRERRKSLSPSLSHPKRSAINHRLWRQTGSKREKNPAGPNPAFGSFRGGVEGFKLKKKPMINKRRCGV